MSNMVSVVSNCSGPTYVADNSEAEEKCQYCSYPQRGYTDYLFDEYRTEYDVFSDGQLDISLGALGHLTVSNYISVAETKDEKTPYLVTHVNIQNDGIGDPFNVDGYDRRRIPIKYCPFCGREL